MSNDVKADTLCTLSSTLIPTQSIIIFLLTTLFTAIIIEVLQTNGCNYWNWNEQITNVTRTQLQSTANIHTYAIYGKSPDEGHLYHVIKVLELLGYKRVNVNDDWNLLWAHDYPFFIMGQRLKQLHSHQMVNHIPGCGFITNKVDLSVTPLPYQPRAFRLPVQREEFLKYSQQHPNALFVEKHNEHRQIAIRAIDEINLNSNDSFIQEFIQKPFLVDDYKFDIGVYVLITSINPLRLYLYTEDVLFRYCPQKYYPFNATNIDKYVVGDDYLPTWQVPSLIKYYELFEGNMKASFDAYVKDKYHHNTPNIIWQQVEHIVRDVVLTKETYIAQILTSYKNKQNFFELMRFDMIIDENLRVHLMEANMSPNLSSAHFKPNALLYDQVLYSVLNLIGIGSPIQMTTKRNNQKDFKQMITSERNLATNLNACAQYECDKSCNNKYCDLCLPCLSGSDYEILVKAHREHLHRIGMKRLFPKPILNPEYFDIETEVQNMSERNGWMSRWFYHKCLYDQFWCF